MIWLLAEGHTVAEVARLTGFVRRWGEEFVVRYNRFGPFSLGDRRRCNGAQPADSIARGPGDAAGAGEDPGRR
jgi:hypothetical protein